MSEGLFMFDAGTMYHLPESVSKALWQEGRAFPQFAGKTMVVLDGGPLSDGRVWIGPLHACHNITFDANGRVDWRTCVTQRTASLTAAEQQQSVDHWNQKKKNHAACSEQIIAHRGGGWISVAMPAEQPGDEEFVEQCQERQRLRDKLPAK